MSVPDVVYELAEAITVYMDSLSLVEALLLAGASTIMVPVVVLIHEAGHAVTAVVLRRRVAELVVGDDLPVLTVRLGGFRLRLGSITGKGDAAGFIVFDGTAAPPRDVFAIALAGPMASLAGALVTGALTAWAWPDPGSALLLALATVVGLILCVDNLRVSGTSPESWSDGVWIRGAWRAMHAASRPDTVATWTDPHAATSVPPPSHQ